MERLVHRLVDDASATSPELANDSVLADGPANHQTGASSSFRPDPEQEIGAIIPTSRADMKVHVSTIAAVLLSLLATTLAAQRGSAAQGARAVTVTAIPGVVAAGATWSIAWQGRDNADGLVGTADGGLLFAQEQPRQISKLDSMDILSVVLTDTRGVGSIGIDSRGRIIGVERTCTDPGRQPAS